MAKKISIVIPSYNEEKNIGRAIRGLLNQATDRGKYEIIVVDNKSTDQTTEVALASGADKVIREEEKGINVARNRGYLESSGEIVAFIDADCVVPPSWLSRLEEDFKDEKVMAVSGPYDYGFRGLKKIVAFLYGELLFSKLSSILEFIFGRKAGVIIGGNFAARRLALHKIGGIPIHLFWGDDAAIAMRISRKVGKVVFDPKLKVPSSPRRFGKDGFIRTVFRYAKAYFREYFSQPA